MELHGDHDKVILYSIGTPNYDLSGMMDDIRGIFDGVKLQKITWTAAKNIIN